MGPLSYMRSVVDRNVVMRRITVIHLLIARIWPARNTRTHAVGKVQRFLVLNQVAGLDVANTMLQKGSTSSTHVTITNRINP